MCSVKMMPAWTPPLNQLNTIIVFDSHFKSSSVSLSFLIITFKKKIWKTFYSSSLKLERIALFHRGESNIIPGKYCFVAQNLPGLALVLFKLMEMLCDRQRLVVISVVSGKFSKSGYRYEWVCLRLWWQNYDRIRGLF